MSEYWKSTPKYWCKYCSIYVKDTKFERANHEATGRHQGSIQRSLRGLHRDQQNQERQQERAKNEVARLNGIVAGKPGSLSTGTDALAGRTPVSSSASSSGAREPERKATREDRQRQWDQLAAMGIAVPEEARPEMALAGEWKVVSQRVIGGDGEDAKPLNVGVRKRKLDEEEEEALEAQETITKKKGWGNSFKRYPGRMGGGDEEDVDALFKRVEKTGVKKEVDTVPNTAVKQEVDVAPEGVKSEAGEPALEDIPTVEEASRKLTQPPDADKHTEDQKQDRTGKTEEGAPRMGFKRVVNAAEPESANTDAPALDEAKDDGPAPAVVFKKRKKIGR